MESLLAGIVQAFTLQNFIFCLIGVTFGMLVGVLPGLGPCAGTAILLPLTFGMTPIAAIIMLAGIYYGSMYGGTITSVLINVPGEAASAITCLDGYPLAQQGRAGVALGVSAIGSFIGGTLALCGLAFIGPPLAKLALNFGPPEFFALMIFAMTTVIGLMGKSVLRGLIAALIGLGLAFIGIDPQAGIMRLTFDVLELQNGLDFIPIVMGLFGLSEILISVESDVKAEITTKLQGLFPRRDEWKPTLLAIGRGTIVGFPLGLIPGSNNVIPTILSYALEKKVAKDSTRFGKGAIEGIAGPETANNAYVGAALIPLFALGIPSSATIAVLLGAFIMHGLQPGPLLFQKSPDFVWAIITSMFIGNFILLFMNLPMAGLWAKLLLVPYKLMFPIITAVMMVGSYSVNNSMFDVGAMIIFGIIGYFFRKTEIPVTPIILTFVLGRIMEDSLLQSLVIFKGNFFGFFARPISGTILGLAIIIILASVWAGIKKKKKDFATDSEI